jgi:VWFA-related protein
MKYGFPVFISVFILLLTTAAAAQIRKFSARTDEVRIDVRVTDHGKPVTDLQASDFEVQDNGVRQEIEYAGAGQIPTSAVLVFDMSGSIAGALHDHLKSAGGDLLGRLRNKDSAALITFSYQVKLDAPLTTDIPQLKAALDRTVPYPSGKTSLIDAAYAGLIYAGSEADMPLLVLFSDGLDTSSYLRDEAVFNAAIRSNVTVYAISAGQLMNRKFLQKLCKISGGNLFGIESTENISDVFINILDEFRQRYILTYSPTGVDKSGWHELEVRVKKHYHDRILARPGYIAD